MKNKIVNFIIKELKDIFLIRTRLLICLTACIIISISNLYRKNNLENEEKFVFNKNERALVDFFIKNRHEFEKNEKKIDSLKDFLLSERGQKLRLEIEKQIKNETNILQKLNIQAYRVSFDEFLYIYKSLKSRVGLKSDNKYYKNTPNDFVKFLKNNYSIEDYKNDYEINYNKKGVIVLTFSSKNISKLFRYNGKSFIEL